LKAAPVVPASDAVAVAADASAVSAPEPTWSLWGDAEP
jgi:hypothetical protein